MYCVVQEIELKKPDKYGCRKTLEAYSPYSIEGNPKYAYRYSDERFERPIKKAYKVSIHESKRINGVVTKKQYAVTTADYYYLAQNWIGDSFYEKKLDKIAAELNTTVDNLWDLINAKIDPLQERIKAEFKKTEEYKTETKHNKIMKEYQKQKAKFAKTYECDEKEYDYCYNIFGELMNSNYFNKIVSDWKTKRSYRNQQRSNYSSNNQDYGNFNFNFGNFLNSSSETYTEDEKGMLKKFYRTLSKEYHPDITKGNGEEMQLINKLKEKWGI